MTAQPTIIFKVPITIAMMMAVSVIVVYASHAQWQPYTGTGLPQELHTSVFNETFMNRDVRGLCWCKTPPPFMYINSAVVSGSSSDTYVSQAREFHEYADQLQQRINSSGISTTYPYLLSYLRYGPAAVVYDGFNVHTRPIFFDQNQPMLFDTTMFSYRSFYVRTNSSTNTTIIVDQCKTSTKVISATSFDVKSCKGYVYPFVTNDSCIPSGTFPNATFDFDSAYSDVWDYINGTGLFTPNGACPHDEEDDGTCKPAPTTSYMGSSYKARLNDTNLIITFFSDGNCTTKSTIGINPIELESANGTLFTNSLQQFGMAKTKSIPDHMLVPLQPVNQTLCEMYTNSSDNVCQWEPSTCKMETLKLHKNKYMFENHTTESTIYTSTNTYRFGISRMLYANESRSPFITINTLLVNRFMMSEYYKILVAQHAKISTYYSQHMSNFTAFWDFWTDWNESVYTSYEQSLKGCGASFMNVCAPQNGKTSDFKFGEPLAKYNDHGIDESVFYETIIEMNARQALEINGTCENKLNLTLPEWSISVNAIDTIDYTSAYTCTANNCMGWSVCDQHCGPPCYTCPNGTDPLTIPTSILTLPTMPTPHSTTTETSTRTAVTVVFITFALAGLLLLLLLVHSFHRYGQTRYNKIV